MKFVYSPLQHAHQKDAIRVLHLAPASDPFTPIRCNVTVSSLSERPTYEALSYVWGPQNNLTTISCNDAELHIGQNLHDALRRLRLSDQTRRLCIDAISINQEDHIEKAHQITLMRQIYAESQRTIVWLGLDKDDNDLAFQLLFDLYQSYNMMAENGDSRTFYQMMPHEVLAYRIPGPDGNRKSFRALKTLLDREWFQRAWVIQEASLPQELQFICGTYEIEFEEFYMALEIITRIGLDYIFTQMGGTRSAAFMIGRLRLETQNNKRSSLLQLLRRTSQCLSTDPRDRIYSLCGLANDAFETGLNIKISYSESYTAKDAYTDFAVSVLQQTKSLDIFSAPHRLDESNPFKLPSWVADWTMTHEIHPFRVEFGDTPGNSFNASGSTWIDPTTSLKIPDTFTADGILVDMLDRTGLMTKIWEVNDAAERWTIDTEIMNNWMELTQADDTSKSYITGETRLDAFWQTLFGGHYAASYEEAKQMFYKRYGYMQRSRFYRNSGLTSFPRLLSLVNIVDNGVQWATGSFVVTSRWNQLTAVQAYRKISISQKGYFSLVPSTAQPGDAVAILRGGHVPFILRKREPPHVEQWELIGEAYVHGIMKGEAWDESKCQDLEIT